MMKLNELYPTGYTQSVFDIDYQKLYQLGFRGIMIDLDGTLVYHDDEPNPQVEHLFQCIRKIGLKTVVLSNNTEMRVKDFLKNIDTPYVCNANKPDPEGFLYGVELLDLPKEKIVVIGDQIFSDILGASRCGLDSILVKYIPHPDETGLGMWRRLEKLILFCRRHSRRRSRKLAAAVKEEDSCRCRKVME